MATNVVGGIEKIEVAPASLTGVVEANAWKQIPNIAPGSVAFTRSLGTRTSIVPEDKDVAFVNFYAPGEGDTLTIGVLEQTPELVQMLFNVDYAAATTMITYKATEKRANLAIKITTRPMKDGRKCIITIYNSEVQTGYANNLTKDAVEQLALTATLGSYRAAGMTEDAIYTKQFVLANGTTIDSTAA